MAELISTIKNLPSNQEPGSDGLTGDSYKLLQDDVTDTLLTVYNGMWVGGPICLWVQRHIKLIPKLGKDTSLPPHFAVEHRRQNPL